VVLFALSVKKDKRPKAAVPLKTKLKIIADFEPGEQAIIRTMEAVFASTRSPH
jgi:hypothetical protein